MRSSPEAVLRTAAPVPDEYLLELGRLVQMGNTAEMVMVGTISLLLGHATPANRLARIMVAHSTAQQRLHAIEALFEQVALVNDDLDGYEKAVGDLRRALAAKTKYVINPFFVFDGKVMIRGTTARGEMKEIREEVRLCQIRAITERIGNATKALHEFSLDKDAQ